jgi:serine/threonine protein kinase
LKDKEAVKLFENELSTLKRLNHRHLVKFVGLVSLTLCVLPIQTDFASIRSYTDPKYIGLLIDPIADGDLRSFLDQAPFPTEDNPALRGYFGCLCSAIKYLHGESIRHKDIKPQNILIKNHAVLVTDFGTARDWSKESHSTTTGKVAAYTASYVAPEVVNWDPRNSSSDVYSLGCVYLDMMVKFHPILLDLIANSRNRIL